MTTRRVARELAGGAAYQIAIVEGKLALSFNVTVSAGKAYLMELYVHRPGDERADCELIGCDCSMSLYDVLHLHDHKRMLAEVGVAFGLEQPEAVWMLMERLFMPLRQS